MKGRSARQEAGGNSYIEDESTAARLAGNIIKGGYRLEQQMFRELYQDYQDNGWKNISRAFGYASGVGIHMISTTTSRGSVMILYLAPKSESPAGQDAINQSLVYYALNRGDIDLLKTFLKRGPDLNSDAVYGTTLLQMALQEDRNIPGRVEAVSALIMAGADPNLPAKNHCTPLELLLRSTPTFPERVELARLLLDNGADPNRAGNYGDRALHSLFRQRKPDPDRMQLLELLLAAHADPLQVNDGGQTVLHQVLELAIDDKSVDEPALIAWLERIITQQTDLNARTRNGKTPLGLAYLSGNVRLREYLQTKGATDHGFVNTAFVPGNDEAANVLGLTFQEIYGMDQQLCQFILKEHGVKFTAPGETSGVKYPIEVQSAIGGVTYRHADDSRKFSIMDCRLALSLVGWAPSLRQRGVREIVHLRAYSPDARVYGGDKVSGHARALALDVAAVRCEDGSDLVVKRDWKDHTPGDPCGMQSAEERPEEARLRNLACDPGLGHMFSMVLTPHYNKEHWDHLHLELDPDLEHYVR